MNNYYIYIYLDPRKIGRYCYEDVCFLFEPIYVGKGKNGRYKRIYGRNPIFKNKINKIKRLEIEPIIFKLYETLSEQQSFELETKLIKGVGRIDLGTGPLVNMTNGGEGTSGYKHTEDELEKRRKNFQEIKNEFKRRNYILLTEETEYKNTHQKLKYVCPEGHKGYICWNDFKNTHNCPYCKKVKINFSDIKIEFENRGYILLTKEKYYKNAHQKLKYICPKGHEGFIKWNDFQQRCGCPTCYNKSRSEKMKGKNSVLIIQDVVQIKLLLKERKLNNRKIADIFGVSEKTISNIKKRKIWNYIKI